MSFKNLNSGDQINPAYTKRRVAVLSTITLVIGLICIGKLGYLQIYKRNELNSLAEQQQLKKWQVPARRGAIYVKDNEGQWPVALNETVKLFYIDPTYIKDKNKFANAVAPILAMSKKELFDLANKKGEYVVVKREVTKEQAEAISKLGLPGLVLMDHLKRVYPDNNFLSHILGFVDLDGKGEYGIENYLNDKLSGVPGQVRARVDKLGVPIFSGENIIRDPVPGSQVLLTVDRSIQAKTEEVLRGSVEAFKAQGGSIIVMDPRTGKILALANQPDFDPNKYFDVKDYTTFENNAYSRVYEPGSVFKIFTMAAGLDQKVITPATTYVDPGELKVDDHVIRNADRKRYGQQTMTQVLEASLNTGTSWVLKQMGGGEINGDGEKKFYDYLIKFGFGQITEIEADLESYGFISKPKTVSKHTYATMTFGQSIAVTPIQLASAVAAIANDGVLMKPYIVEKITSPSGKVIEAAPKEVRTVISRETAAQLKAMMVSVVVRGHGKRAGVAGYNVAGKTGTAQIPKKGGGYEEHANIGSFVGFAPAENPKFVIVVKIDRPKITWAESSAAPVFGELSSYLFRHMQIPPSK